MDVSMSWNAALWPELPDSATKTEAENANPNDTEEALISGYSSERSKLHKMSDAKLMRAISGCDTDALEELYDRHMRGCFGLAMKIVRDPAVAEEAVQDVFIKLWNQPTVFSPERGNFSGWLLTLVHNRSVDKLRRASSKLNNNTVPLDAINEAGVSLADLLPDTAPGPDDRAWAQEKGRVMRRVLSELPDTQRRAIELAYFEGLTQKEIAEKLQEPLGTIKTRTRSGLQQLRKALSVQGLWVDLH